MRRIIQWACGVMITIGVLAPSSATFAAETALKVVDVSLPAVSLLQSPLFAAIESGAFKKYGMEVRYIVTGARSIQALIGGSVNFAQGVSSRTVPSAVLAGFDAVLIANFSDKFLFTMHSAPEINSLQDLKGKIVGVSGLGGSTDFATRVALHEAGLVPDKDVMIRGGLDIWYQRTRDGRRLTGEKPIALPQHLPSEYFHRQIWISYVDDPLGVKMVGNVLDADKVMFGSDYPHPASTWPNSQAANAAQIESLPTATVQKITRDNARALFGIA